VDAISKCCCLVVTTYDFSIEMIYKPHVLDNITNLYVFNDDQHILHFMLNVDVFKDATIDEDEHDKALEDVAWERKENPILKGVLSLENMHDLQNHFRGLVNAKTHSSTLSH